MENKFAHLNQEEKLKLETELLKLKLLAENNAVLHQSESLALSAQAEYDWHNHIYHYEKLCKEAGYTTVYDLIGKPFFKQISQLEPAEIGTALDSLLQLMHEKRIGLNYLEDCYTPETLYRFLTEELFDQQICRYRGPGQEGYTMFCYEEFHPNHPYDLNRYTKEYLESLLGERPWNRASLKYTHDKRVTVNGLLLSLNAYSDRIDRFKECYPHFLFSGRTIDTISFDEEAGTASSKGTICIGEKLIPYTIRYALDYELWVIYAVDIELL